MRKIKYIKGAPNPVFGSGRNVSARVGLLAAVIGAAIAVTAPAVHGQGFQSLESIREAVRVFLRDQTASQNRTPRIDVGRLDPRLRLVHCPAPLQAALAPGSDLSGSTTVQVRCSGPKPWSLYVQASVRLVEPVVVAARPLGRGGLIGADDVELVEKDVSRLNGGYFTELQAVVGMRLKRSVGPGLPLNRYSVEQRKVVRRGERVTILARAGGLEVRMAGKALSSGSKGDTISVKNLSSNREIEATVTAPGIVQVHM